MVRSGGLGLGGASTHAPYHLLSGAVIPAGHGPDALPEWPVPYILACAREGVRISLDAINKEVFFPGRFPNFKNGTEILQMALTQFVEYYHRFHNIVSTLNPSVCPNRDQLINIHQLMVEVKKYKPNF